jgi:hypothetical protein
MLFYTVSMAKKKETKKRLDINEVAVLTILTATEDTSKDKKKP